MGSKGEARARRAAPAPGAARPRRAILRLLASLPAALLAACAPWRETPASPADPPAPASPAAAARPTAAPATPGRAEAEGPATPSPPPEVLAPTPACPDEDHPTPPQTAGPFFKPSSPERASLLEPGMPGTRILLSGTVLDPSCQPVAGALLDFWHADDSGRYDNLGYRLRGHQFADAQGGYALETVVPGLYPGRTRHFHVRVQAPGGPVLTTQLYFPGEPANQRDGLFHPALLVSLEDGGEEMRARFEFVLERI